MLRELAYFRTTRKEQSAPLQQAVWRLGELETYVSCLQRLADAAALSDLKSQGMQALLAFVERRARGPGIPAPGKGTARAARRPQAARQRQHRHQPGRPVAARRGDAAGGARREIRRAPLLSRIFGAATPYQPVASIKPWRAWAACSATWTDSRRGGAPAGQALGQYVRLQVQDLLSLEREIAFYLGAAQLFGALRHAACRCAGRGSPASANGTCR